MKLFPKNTKSKFDLLFIEHVSAHSLFRQMVEIEMMAQRIKVDNISINYISYTYYYYY